MTDLKGKLAVVTGASAGIGAAIVRELLSAGMIVIGLARRCERVEDMKRTLPSMDQCQRLHGIRCDVTNSDDVALTFSNIRQIYGRIYALINCAGCLRSGQLCVMNASVVQEVLQTNIMGVVHCTKHAFGYPIDDTEEETLNNDIYISEKSVQGHVVLINSIFGHKVPPIPGHVPSLNIYPATKHAVTAMNEMYRQEFRELGKQIKTTSISPGLVDTEFITEQRKRICKGKILQPDAVAQAVMFALRAPEHVLIYEVVLKPLGEMI